MSPGAVLLAALVGALLLLVFRRRMSRPKLPPGPPGLPIIGNLHMLGALPHRSLARLSKKYGPIMSIKLGRVLAIVASSPETAQLFLKTHDAVFASRPQTEVAEHVHYGNKGLVMSQYGPYWRNVRRLCTMKLLNPAKIDSFAGSRKRVLTEIVRSLRDAAAAGKEVDVSSGMGSAIEDMVCLMVIGRPSNGRFKLKEVIREATNLLGQFNVGEFIPFLMPFDLQGLTKRTKATAKGFDEILETIIDEHIQEGNRRGEREEDFVDVLLSLLNSPKESRDLALTVIDKTNIKAILVDMIGAASDTSFSSAEWAFAELMRHPRVMRKLQEEIKSVVGLDRMVEEADLPKLPYLEMVIKESLRLHPSGHLLVPRESMEDITINGYFIPKKSRVMINVWAIAQDPKVWPDRPQEFIPERFINSSVDVLGQHFELLPFGSGRRGCAGTRLGLITVRLMLATLIHCFDWELAGGATPDNLDMTEKYGIATPRLHPIVAVPTCRF